MGQLDNLFSEAIVNAAYSPDVWGDSILYNGIKIIAVVDLPVESTGPIETGLIKRVVNVKKSDISTVPREGDQVQISFNPEESTGDYWNVAKVITLPLEYEIHFTRYIG